MDVDIQLGNIEENDVGDNGVRLHRRILRLRARREHWSRGLERVLQSPAPRRRFLLLGSTNKFSFTPYEYDFPLYGWLPDQWRYKLRIARQGADVMKLGIDFNQFRYGLLRREFRRIGFTRIIDRIDRLELSTIASLR